MGSPGSPNVHPSLLDTGSSPRAVHIIALGLPNPTPPSMTHRPQAKHGTMFLISSPFSRQGNGTMLSQGKEKARRSGLSRLAIYIPTATFVAAWMTWESATWNTVPATSLALCMVELLSRKSLPLNVSLASEKDTSGPS